MYTLKESLSFQFNTKVESAYIIVLKDNLLSEKMFSRCLKSCNEVDMPCKRWEAFDGTQGEIIVPTHLRNKDWLSWMKISNSTLVNAEIGAMLSHISLWAHCVAIDRPIVILEHDAVFLKKFQYHKACNAIVYLGCHEQARNEFPCRPIPPMWFLGKNFSFINRVHAYSIDPLIARRLLAEVILSGIKTSADTFIRSDIFTQIQMGLYAIDLPHDVTTCSGRDKRNSDLEKQKINYKLLF